MRACEKCGCTDANPCTPPCFWIAPRECSTHAPFDIETLQRVANTMLVAAPIAQRMVLAIIDRLQNATIGCVIEGGVLAEVRGNIHARVVTADVDIIEMCCKNDPGACMYADGEHPLERDEHADMHRRLKETDALPLELA